MQESPNFARGIGLSAVMYGALFFGHIAAAANGLTLLFRLIAVSITLMTFLLGGFVWFFSGRAPHRAQLCFQIGFFASVPLSLGLAYAYANQSFNVSYSIVFLTTTAFTHFLSVRLHSWFMD